MDDLIRRQGVMDILYSITPQEKSDDEKMEGYRLGLIVAYNIVKLYDSAKPKQEN